jgi:hypothetical protein
MRGVAGPDWRRVLDDTLPGAFDQAVADADTFFDQELPAVQRWSFGRRDAGRIRQPVLAVLGGASHQVSPVWGERQALLEAWLDDVEPFVLAGATHLLHLQRPRAMAEALAGLLRPAPAQRPLTANSCGRLPRWNGTMVTLTFSIEPRTLVRPAEVWSCRTRRQKPT